MPIRRRKGAHRKKLAKSFPKKLYNKRLIIEGIFSAIKRKFGQRVYSKKFKTQKNEMLFRTIAYNVDRLEKEGITIYFLQSLNLRLNVPIKDQYIYKL